MMMIIVTIIIIMTIIINIIMIIIIIIIIINPVSVRRFPSFRTQPLENLAPLPMNKWSSEQPSPQRKSSKRESCYGDRVYIPRRHAEDSHGLRGAPGSRRCCIILCHYAIQLCCIHLCCISLSLYIYIYIYIKLLMMLTLLLVTHIICQYVIVTFSYDVIYVLCVRRQ